jgi:hypothetical protein
MRISDQKRPKESSQQYPAGGNYRTIHRSHIEEAIRKQILSEDTGGRTA